MSRPVVARLARLAALVAATVGVLGLGAAPAVAHAVLIGAQPADGAGLDAAPGEVSVEFSEPVSPPPQAVRVFDAGGSVSTVGTLAGASSRRCCASA